MSTVDLPVLASSGQLLFTLKMYFLLYKAYLIKEINSTEPSPSVGVPGLACLQTFSGGRHSGANVITLFFFVT